MKEEAVSAYQCINLNTSPEPFWRPHAAVGAPGVVLKWCAGSSAERYKKKSMGDALWRETPIHATTLSHRDNEQ